MALALVTDGPKGVAANYADDIAMTHVGRIRQQSEATDRLRPVSLGSITRYSFAPWIRSVTGPLHKYPMVFLRCRSMPLSSGWDESVGILGVSTQAQISTRHETCKRNSGVIGLLFLRYRSMPYHLSRGKFDSLRKTSSWADRCHQPRGVKSPLSR